MEKVNSNLVFKWFQLKGYEFGAGASPKFGSSYEAVVGEFHPATRSHPSNFIQKPSSSMISC